MWLALSLHSQAHVRVDGGWNDCRLCFVPVFFLLFAIVMAIFGTLLGGLFSGLHHP